MTSRLLTTLLLALTCQAATIILVRHAERAGGMEADVPLSDRGRQRADTLAGMLADSGIKAIYTSEVTRTKQTAAPLAERLHIEPTIVPARDVGELVTRLKALGASDTVLVVGHSNTVPEIVHRLGAETPPIGETEFDRLLVVHTGGDSPARVLTLRYDVR